MRNNRPAGFTLVELLVALVLFALLSAALFAALRSGAATTGRITTRQDDIASLNAARQRLAASLTGAYPEYLPAPTPGISGHVTFDGAANTIAFLATAPLAIATGGLAAMQLSLSGAPPDISLSLAATPELSRPGTAATREILLSGIAAASFAYLGADTPSGPLTWHASWANRQALPQLIRIRVSFSAQDNRLWPDLLIAPKIITDSACRFVELTQSCLGR